jgi:hypothetical protein
VRKKPKKGQLYVQVLMLSAENKGTTKRTMVQYEGVPDEDYEEGRHDKEEQPDGNQQHPHCSLLGQRHLVC